MSGEQFDVARHFDKKLPDTYDKRIRQVIPDYESMHEMAKYQLVASTKKTNANILVAGVGTGHEAIAYAQNQPGWEITGFDLSSKMLSVAHSKISNFGIKNRITLVHGNIKEIDEDSPFDGAASILVMQFLPDNGQKQKYLHEISRRLTAGAGIVLIDLEGVKHTADYNVLLAAWKTHQFETRKNKDEVERDFMHVENDFHLISEGRIRELLTDAGFTGICKFYKSFLLGGYVATKK
ncbi:MAG: class I SAM-dependent methyltransferase [Desulfobulbaceae bacterium]|nr:class I SAM-dependent methyltransferase [Desulfobulbaceae bacterium]